MTDLSGREWRTKCEDVDKEFKNGDLAGAEFVWTVDSLRSLEDANDFMRVVGHAQSKKMNIGTTTQINTEFEVLVRDSKGFSRRVYITVGWAPKKMYEPVIEIRLLQMFGQTKMVVRHQAFDNFYAGVCDLLRKKDMPKWDRYGHPYFPNAQSEEKKA